MASQIVFQALEQHRALIERTRENTARTARSYARHRTTGWGEMIVHDAVMFGCTFIERPFFTSGVEIVSSATGVEAEPVTGRFPRVDVGVWRWVQDHNGFYTGAFIYYLIETIGYQVAGGASIPSQGLDPGYVIDHSLVFEGVSYKDFNPAGLDL